MLQDNIQAYFDSLSVNDTTKDKYMKHVKLCAEFFDNQHIELPNAENWEAFKEHYSNTYMKEHEGKTISDRTLNQALRNAKNFCAWCTHTEPPANEPEQTQNIIPDNSAVIEPVHEVMPKIEPEILPEHEGNLTPSYQRDNSSVIEDMQASEQTQSYQPQKHMKQNSSKAGVRVNFILPADTYKLLSMFAAVKNTNLTEIMKEATEAYFTANAALSDILRNTLAQVKDI